jgi:hypothetical protein
MNTTDLNLLRKTPNHFTWGHIRAIHDIGPYTIIEYTSAGSGIRQFHVYVDGKDTSTATLSLEGALVEAIARKSLADNPNTARYMAIGACKLLGIPCP